MRRRGLLMVGLALLLAGLAWGEPKVGRMGVLLDCHGVNRNGQVVVPLTPLVHWLGATMCATGTEWTLIERGNRQVMLTIPNDRVTALRPLVPLRGIAEDLGVTVRYRAFDSDEAAAIGHIPHVELTDGERLGRVLVHAAQPATVAAILAAVSDEELGQTWLLRVSAMHEAAGRRWAKTHEPKWREEQGFGERYVTGVLEQVEGTWRYALRTTKVSHAPADLREAGVPLEVARALKMQIEAEVKGPPQQ